MLARVAESLYWMARYIERAEDTTRLLHVNFHALLDADRPTAGAAGASRRCCTAATSSSTSTSRRTARRP